MPQNTKQKKKKKARGRGFISLACLYDSMMGPMAPILRALPVPQLGNGLGRIKKKLGACVRREVSYIIKNKSARRVVCGGRAVVAQHAPRQKKTEKGRQGRGAWVKHFECKLNKRKPQPPHSVVHQTQQSLHSGTLLVRNCFIACLTFRVGGLVASMVLVSGEGLRGTYI
jgi:hypothetical protein